MSIKMYGLQLGHFGMDLEILLTGHPNCLLLPNQRDRPKVWYECPALAYIIEHPEGRILFETGVSAHWNDEWPEDYLMADWANINPEQFLEQKLESVGLGPEDFRYVVIGHMHVDHAGGLRLFEKAGTEIVMHEDEYKGVMALEQDTGFFCRSDYEFLPTKKPTLVYGEQELLDGVRLVSLPGHTWGTMGMLVNRDHTGWVMLTSDAMYHHETYGPPAVGSFVGMHQNQWAESLEKVRRYATKYEALIVPGHDETGVKQHADGTSEFVKLEYYPGHVYE